MQIAPSGLLLNRTAQLALQLMRGLSRLLYKALELQMFVLDTHFLFCLVQFFVLHMGFETSQMW